MRFPLALFLPIHYLILISANPINPPLSLPLTLQNTTHLSLSNPSFQQWRILNTPTSLRIALLSDHPIPKPDLGNTILSTQVTLRTYIQTHYKASETALTVSDDPYKSSPRFTNCFVGVHSFPNGNKHLTYGVMANVLQGLWDYLYRGERFAEAVFEVQDEVWGTVGLGKVSRRVPGEGVGVV